MKRLCRRNGRRIGHDSRHPLNPRVQKVRARADYRLELTFSNGEVGTYDCGPLLQFGVFKELQDKSYFRKARAEGGTVVWPHEQDICPDTLYLDSEKKQRPRRPAQRLKRATCARKPKPPRPGAPRRACRPRTGVRGSDGR